MFCLKHGRWQICAWFQRSVIRIGLPWANSLHVYRRIFFVPCARYSDAVSGIVWQQIVLNVRPHNVAKNNFGWSRIRFLTSFRLFLWCTGIFLLNVFACIWSCIFNGDERHVLWSSDFLMFQVWLYFHICFLIRWAVSGKFYLTYWKGNLSPAWFPYNVRS